MTQDTPDILDRVLDQLLAEQGMGCDISNIEIELRERGPERTEVSPSLARTRDDINRASEDTCELVRAEDPALPTIVMSSTATPPGELRVADITKELAESVGTDLDSMNEAYDTDPALVRGTDTITSNVVLAAYYGYRAAVLGYAQFMRKVAIATEGVGSYLEPKDAKDVVKGVIIAVTAAIILSQWGIAAS